MTLQETIQQIAQQRVKIKRQLRQLGVAFDNEDATEALEAKLTSINHFTFQWHKDAAHGWLEVPRELLKTLDIAEKISAYSYQSGDFVYLEEDCDWPLFAKAMAAEGLRFSYVRKYSEFSDIRNFPRYQP